MKLSALTKSLIMLFGIVCAQGQTLVLNEVKSHAPVGPDASYEYIEIKGTPATSLADHYLVVLDGRAASAGNATVVIDLNARVPQGLVPSSGLIVIKAMGGYSVSSQTAAIVTETVFDTGGAIPNDAATILLIRLPTGTAAPTVKDYDAGVTGGDPANNGILDQAPLTNPSMIVVDSIGWRGSGEFIYPSSVITPRLDQTTGKPDAATRFPGNIAARTAGSWFFGCLEKGSGGGQSGDYLGDATRRSANFPNGPANAIFLTPGAPNEPNDSNSPGNSTPSPINVVGPQVRLINATYDWIRILLPTSAAVGAIQAIPSNPSILFQMYPWYDPIIGRWELSIDPMRACSNEFVTLIPDGNWNRARTFPFAAIYNLGLHRGTAKHHSGVSDGSTAIPLAGTMMLLGDDETNPIRLYDRTASGPTLNSFLNLDALCEVNLLQAPEIDIEASARIGNVIYWIGGHANGPFDISDPDPSKWDVAMPRPNRNRLFATTITSDGGTPQSTAIAFGNTTLSPSSLGYNTNIRSRLFAWNTARYNLSASAMPGAGEGTATPVQGVDSKRIDGFNIEGLAPSPDNSRLYIGFRAPLVPVIGLPNARRYALIAALNNFPQLVTGTPTPPLGSVRNNVLPTFDAAGIELDLSGPFGGRGIRSLERVGAGPTYLIIAGPPTPSDYRPGHFALFTWNGNVTTPVVTELIADLAGKNIESIVELVDSGVAFANRIRILEDNGTYDWYGTGGRAKDYRLASFGEYRHTRSSVITVGRPATVTYTLDLPANNLHPGTLGRSEGFAIERAAVSSSAASIYGFSAAAANSTELPCVATAFGTLPVTGLQPLTSPAQPAHRVLGAFNEEGDTKAVGYSSDSFGNKKAVLWNVANYSIERDFGTLSGGAWSEIRGIAYNAIETSPYVVVGASAKTGGQGAFQWYQTDRGAPNDIIWELPGTTGSTVTMANAVNSNGVVVGASGLNSATRVACAWVPNRGIDWYPYDFTPISLGTLPNGGASEALAINNNGTIVGYAYTTTANTIRHACMWVKIDSRYQIFDLNTLVAGGSSEARGINDWGQIVGNATFNSSWTHGCMWLNGSIIDLNTRLSSNPNGGEITTANAVNNAGQITGAWAPTTGSALSRMYYLHPN